MFPVCICGHLYILEEQGLVPNVVTLGKPIGKGFHMSLHLKEPALQLSQK